MITENKEEIVGEIDISEEHPSVVGTYKTELTPFSHFNGDFQIDNSFAPIKVRRNVYARRSTSQFQIDHWEADDVALVRLDSSVDSLEEDKLKLRDTKITVEVEALSDGTYNRKVKYEALA